MFVQNSKNKYLLVSESETKYKRSVVEVSISFLLKIIYNFISSILSTHSLCEPFKGGGIYKMVRKPNLTSSSIHAELGHCSENVGFCTKNLI